MASTYASELGTGMIVISGVEIETTEGHILVLGIKNSPPKSLSVAETIDFARKEGGITIIPHPGIPFVSVSDEIIRRSKPDAIETHNAKAPFFRHFVEKNTKLAESLGLSKTGGSDAHSHRSVGDAYTIVDADSRSVEDILEAIRRGRTQPEGEASNLIENIKTTIQVFLRTRIFSSHA
jgi:predicted metal-dependent phosphoesterase TrpH